MAVTLDDLVAELPPLLAEDEITVGRVKERAHVGHKRAEQILKDWQVSGVIVYAGKRRNGSRVVDAWRIVGK